MRRPRIPVSMDLGEGLHCARPIVRDREVTLQKDTSTRWPLGTKIGSSLTRKDQAVRLVNWNIARHTPRSWQGISLDGEIHALNPDPACMIEAWVGSFQPNRGYEISARGVAWSPQHNDERKVLLWSTQPLRDVESVDELEATGTGITGITGLEGVAVAIGSHTKRDADRLRSI